MLDSTDENSPQIERERNEVVTEFDEEARLKLEVIQNLLEPCDQAKPGTARSRYLWQKVERSRKNN